jgi:hypothetical protein
MLCYPVPPREKKNNSRDLYPVLFNSMRQCISSGHNTSHVLKDVPGFYGSSLPCICPREMMKMEI